MPGRLPGIHVFLRQTKRWMAGDNPAIAATVRDETLRRASDPRGTA
jgi:hypothetical protein